GGSRAAQTWRYRDSELPRHGRGREPVRPHRHDLPREEGPRRHAGIHSGPVRKRHHSRRRRGRLVFRPGASGRGEGSRSGPDPGTAHGARLRSPGGLADAGFENPGDQLLRHEAIAPRHFRSHCRPLGRGGGSCIGCSWSQDGTIWPPSAPRRFSSAWWWPRSCLAARFSAWPCSRTGRISRTGGLAIVLLSPVVIPLCIMMPIMNQPNGVLATAVSLFPPFTPMLMLMRQAMPGGVPAWQPWVGVVGVLACTFGTAWAAARLFRVGI